MVLRAEEAPATGDSRLPQTCSVQCRGPLTRPRTAAGGYQDIKMQVCYTANLSWQAVLCLGPTCGAMEHERTHSRRCFGYLRPQPLPDSLCLITRATVAVAYALDYRFVSVLSSFPIFSLFQLLKDSTDALVLRFVYYFIGRMLRESGPMGSHNEGGGVPAPQWDAMTDGAPGMFFGGSTAPLIALRLECPGPRTALVC